jgi:RNA polymerase sigma-70 factor (ECF subfamily)
MKPKSTTNARSKKDIMTEGRVFEPVDPVALRGDVVRVDHEELILSDSSADIAYGFDRDTATTRLESRVDLGEAACEAEPPRDDSEAGTECYSDAWLVEKTRGGDDEAFARLVFRYERKLIRVLNRLVHDEESARDLAQETFWKVYTQLDRFDTARRFGPWLFRIGVNLGVDHLRRRESTSLISSHRKGSGGFEPTIPDPRNRREIVQEVRHVLALLPMPYRTILILRDLEGFSSAEAAAIVGRREATIRWRLARARDQFREIWRRRQDSSRQEKSDVE